MRTYTEELITPEIARSYLKLNTHNRALKPQRIAPYAEQMAAGSWRPNGEGIKFGTHPETGETVLLDGQNRLHAIIEADTPVLMLVVTGLEMTDQEVMDVGLGRKLNDILTLRGERGTTGLSAVIRALYIWDNAPDSRKRRVGGSGQDGKGGASNSALLAYFDANSDMCRLIAEESSRISRGTRLAASILAPLIREFDVIDAEDAKDFWHRLETAQPSPLSLGPHDPITQLHRNLSRMRETNKVRYDFTEIAALIVKAWNGYRQGKPIMVLHWRSGGSKPEPFPVAQ